MNLQLSEWLAYVRRAFSRPLSWADYARMLQDELARSREEVTRARVEIERQRAEVERVRGEIEYERAEIARLRLENRAMLNSLLGTAGVPPVEEARNNQTIVRRGGPHFWRPQT